MYTTRIVIDVIECLSHKNTAVRTMADKFCELVSEYDRQPTGELGQLGMQIRKKRFEGFNQAWVAQCAPESLASRSSMMDDGMDDDLVSIGPNGVPGPHGHANGLYYGDRKLV